VILLSGTPALSRPIELFTQLHALQPCIFVHRHHFGVRYCAAVKGRFGWEYTGNSNLQELHALMRHFCMIRRLKSEVLQDLPEKRRQTMVYQVQDKELKASLEAVEIDELARRELKCAVDVENGHSSEAQQVSSILFIYLILCLCLFDSIKPFVLSSLF
jgi:SWI/SNF-related matrix-associated actin-dependent regulator 1 of chromatin subfamily A